jgi:hypothetical protein
MGTNVESCPIVRRILIFPFSNPCIFELCLVRNAFGFSTNSSLSHTHLLAILPLDEVTSTLGRGVRARRAAALERVKNWTTVLVAHRLLMIKNADVISVLQDDKIIE